MNERLHVVDRAERVAALDPTRSFIVQAPAGSGKTSLLIQRYLRLLASVESPEEIVAITFTRKAAGEMRSRVLSALGEASVGRAPDGEHEQAVFALAQAALGRDRELGWNVLANPARLRIQTIDSLCAALTRQMPLLSRFGAQPAVSDDPEALYRAAVRETLALLEAEEHWSAPVGRLLRHLDNNVGTLETLLIDMLARRDQWLRHVMLGKNGGVKRDTMEAALAAVVSDGLRAAHAAMPQEEQDEMVELARFAGGNLRDSGSDAELAAWAHAQIITSATADDVARWLGLANLLLTNEGLWRRRVDTKLGFPAPSSAKTPASRALYQDMKNRHEALIARLSAKAETFRARLGDLRALPPVRYSDEQWAVMAALFELLPMAAAQLRLVFRDRGEVDFTEIAQSAVHALGEPDNPTDLALALDYRIRHLLVDEFQDTSFSQYALLERLTAGWEAGDGRTLFLVGDPMQSIYRFREAEVGLFLRARRDGLGGITLAPLVLRVNFRSRRPVVEWVNEIFAALMPDQEDMTTGAVAYSESAAVHDGEAVVHIHPLIGDDLEEEAKRVVELVGAAQHRRPDGTIGILVQARSHLSAILPALKQAGFAYRAIDIEQLAHRPVIQDLMALTRALLHPADRVAWLAILRAPWCGLTLSDIYALAGETEHVICGALDDEAILGRLSEDGASRLRRAWAVLREAMLQRRRRPLRQWVEGVWLALGGPACMERETDLADADAFLDLLERLEQGSDLPDFKTLNDEVERLFSAPDLAGDGLLQVMTVHRAKGLEFDTVILAGLGRTPRAEQRRLLMWMERPRKGAEPDLLLSPIPESGGDDDPIYAYLRRIDRQKAAFETGRLLYVAATRAREALHLVAHAEAEVTEDGPRVKPPRAGCLLHHLWPWAEPIFAAHLTTQPTLVASPLRPARVAAPIRRLHRDWQLPAPSPLPHVPAAPASVTIDETIEFLWASDTARHVGTVVHRMLRQIAREGASGWDGRRVQQRRPSYMATLARLGVPEAEIAVAAHRVETALVRVLEDGRGRWLLSHGHEDAHCEYALTGVEDGRPINIIIDRTFIDDKGVRWIVDYKVGIHEGGDIAAFLDNEQLRYRAQVERYARLFSQMEERPIRLGLYFPLLRGWREWSPPGT